MYYIQIQINDMHHLPKQNRIKLKFEKYKKLKEKLTKSRNLFIRYFDFCAIIVNFELQFNQLLFFAII